MSAAAGPDLADLAELAPLLAAARGSGRVVLAEADEAELRAVGWDSPGREAPGDSVADGSPAAVASAGRRLADRGLAVADRPGIAPGAVASAGGLRAYLSLALRHQSAIFAFATSPQGGGATWSASRAATLTVPGLAVVEHVVRPGPDGPTTTLPVSLVLTTVEELRDAWVDEAFRGPATDADRAAARGTESTLVGGAGTTPAARSRLVHSWDDEHAVLRWQARSLFGARPGGELVGFRPVTHRHVTRQRYAGHVGLRLAWAPRRPRDAAGRG